MENVIIHYEPFFTFLYTFTILQQKMVSLQSRCTIEMNHFSTSLTRHNENQEIHATSSITC